MSRVRKSNTVSRYLVSRTGIIGITYDTSIRNLSAPHPYHISVTTNVKDDALAGRVKVLPRDRISCVIRYDKWIDDISDAIVSMRLSDYVKLLGAHSEMINKGRGEDK